MHRWLRAICCSAAIGAMVPIHAIAGTTGGIVGRTTDSKTQAPLAGVSVTANSPSQTATAVTDASGQFRFLSLAPDTYTVTLSKEGYSPVSQPGVSIFADQVQTLNVALVPSLKVIAQTTSRSAADLVKPGATGDVFSINAAGARAAASLVGPGGLNSAYGAIASVPGVQVDAGEAGWFQTVHIRGGDIDQVGYELDGIPVNRAYDNAPMTMLSSLGQQELQVYTGGTPASADAQGISGFVNQVVRTGTFPGFAQSNLSVGSPAFYHQASVEAGGSSPDRLFSYYVGIGGADQDYRYVDNSNGAGIPNSFFYPMNLVDPNTFSPGNNGWVYTGANGLNDLFVGGQAFGIASSQQRDTMFNVHFGIPHKSSGLRDDVQILYLTSSVFAQYYSSQNDLGPNVVNQLGQLAWNDSSLYTGPLMQAPVQSALVPYLFPSSPTQRAIDAPLPAAQRDANDNGVAVTKLQYQHAFSSSAFLRAYGYLLYSNWFINGPNTAAQPYYGAELAEYQIPNHTAGANVSFTDQLGAQNLLTATANYVESNLQRYYVGYIHPSYGITNLVGANSNCVDPTSGSDVPCYGSLQGTQNAGLTPAPAPAGAQWIVTNNHFNAPLNQVHPRFSGFSISDQWRPNDQLTFNIGARLENFTYLFGDTGTNDPARQFWFLNYNRDYCVANSTSVPFQNVNAAGVPILGPCPAGTQHTNLQNPSVNSYTTSRFEPRIGFTDALNPQTVVRGSFGVYARPPNTSWVQYNVVQQDLPTYLGSHFYAYGFNTPEHYIKPDTSYNADLSLEQRLKGTDVTFKFTPFYRATKDQLQNFYIDPQGGLESGLNVGNQESYGVELAIQKGDFAKNGVAGAFSYTYTHSRIKYNDFSGTNTNVIDQLNGYIQQYNSYTKAGGGSPCFTPATGTGPGTASPCGPGTIVNPYYAAAAAPIFDRNAWYPTYDVIPGPFAGANGYGVPNTATLILNYRHDKYAVTPSFSFSSGAEYGSPTVWPGYIPQTCTAFGPALSSGARAADPASCTDNGNLPLFIPDPYTHKFDNLGDFQEPWRFSMSLALEYDLSSKVIAHLTLTNLVDSCGQRGYAWDNPSVCVYGALPSGIMAPKGNFYPNSQEAVAPAQMQYPYSYWLNNNNTGFVGVTIPMQVTFEVQFKL
ncbi:MAG: carboxypeptidase regulatory-like domain-containing protein [Vulcanimicrobiaceae bacterium]